MKRRIALGLILLFTGCSSDPKVKELEQAARAVEQVVAPAFASRSSFFVVLPNGTPRQFVSWFFSPMGTAEWPPVDQPSESGSEELEAMKQFGMALRPVDVAYRHTAPDTSIQKQIVLKWDDAEGVVLLEGYLDPHQEPVFTKSMKLPTGVVPDAVAKGVTQVHLDDGMAFQSF